jgi:hypothetical protein
MPIHQLLNPSHVVWTMVISKRPTEWLVRFAFYALLSLAALLWVKGGDAFAGLIAFIAVYFRSIVWVGEKTEKIYRGEMNPDTDPDPLIPQHLRAAPSAGFFGDLFEGYLLLFPRLRLWLERQSARRAAKRSVEPLDRWLLRKWRATRQPPLIAPGFEDRAREWSRNHGGGNS